MTISGQKNVVLFYSELYQWGKNMKFEHIYCVIEREFTENKFCDNLKMKMVRRINSFQIRLYKWLNLCNQYML